MAFIDSNQLLYKSQYGFRKQMSTSLAILKLVEEITNSHDEHKSTVGVFIDLKKVFDTVDHIILIQKLYHYGIRGTANKWICSSVGFLPGRKVFLPHEGEKQGRKYFCHSFCHFCRGERAGLIKT